MATGRTVKRTTLLSSGQIAEHCQVSYETVSNWIKSGKLSAHQTPGGHRRIKIDDFDDFLARHGMPLFGRRQRPGYRILIVDDSVSTADMYAKMLATTRRYEISVCYDGFEAGMNVERERPDLILLDLLLPGIDGFRICTMVKENPEYKRIKILVITGSATAENLQRVLESGADGWLAKPVGVYELIDKVEKVLQVGGAEVVTTSATA
jgi:two-component system response regulator VicR